MKYYQQKLDRLGVVYSVDMVRLSIELYQEMYEELFKYMNSIEFIKDEIEIQYFTSIATFKYRDMFTIKLKDCSFVLGLSFNGLDNIDRNKGFLEFNPNKCMHNELFIEIYQKIMYCAFDVELKRYDLALDIPEERKNVRIVQDRRDYQLIKSRNGLTEYLGQRSSGGFVKLYDKTKESNLNVTLTRLEITMDADTVFEKAFPDIYITSNQFSFVANEKELNATDLVLLELLQGVDNVNYYLNKLGRVKKEKLRQYIYEDRLFVYDSQIVGLMQFQAKQYANKEWVFDVKRK